MASSSENLLSNIDSLAFMRPNFSDYWLSELFSRDNITAETQTITRALQMSLEPAFIQIPVHTPIPTPVHTPTASASASDPDTPTLAATPKRHRGAGGVAAGKVAKRKSRATKRSLTTFITADAANFRQMVQQVTGVRFAGDAAAQFATAAPLIKPEPLRGFGSSAAARFSSLGMGGACPPTLDTSALLLDQSRTQTPAAASPAEAVAFPSVMVTSFVSGDGSEFDALQSFPTLESWKVM